MSAKRRGWCAPPAHSTSGPKKQLHLHWPPADIHAPAHAGAVPGRQRALFEASPVQRWVGGLPVISYVGAISLAACAFMEWVFLSDPHAGLKTIAKPFFDKIPYGTAWLNVAIFLSGLLLCYVAKAVQSRRGVNVDLVYKEGPSE